MNAAVGAGSRSCSGAPECKCSCDRRFRLHFAGGAPMSWVGAPVACRRGAVACEQSSSIVALIPRCYPRQELPAAGCVGLLVSARELKYGSFGCCTGLHAVCASAYSCANALQLRSAPCGHGPLLWPQWPSCDDRPNACSPDRPATIWPTICNRVHASCLHHTRAKAFPRFFRPLQ
jgi:hypothetical protein